MRGARRSARPDAGRILFRLILTVVTEIALIVWRFLLIFEIVPASNALGDDVFLFPFFFGLFHRWPRCKPVLRSTWNVTRVTFLPYNRALLSPFERRQHRRPYGEPGFEKFDELPARMASKVRPSFDLIVSQNLVDM